jgi:hypothetical protein
MRKAYRAPISASQQFRNANNSIQGRANSVANDNVDFDRSNTFN